MRNRTPHSNNPQPFPQGRILVVHLNQAQALEQGHCGLRGHWPGIQRTWILQPAHTLVCGRGWSGVGGSGSCSLALTLWLRFPRLEFPWAASPFQSQEQGEK